VVVVLFQHRAVCLEYWLTHDCVVGVQVDQGMCGGSTVSTQDCVVGVQVDPGLCGGSTG